MAPPGFTKGRGGGERTEQEKNTDEVFSWNSLGTPSQGQGPRPRLQVPPTPVPQPGPTLHLTTPHPHKHPHTQHALCLTQTGGRDTHSQGAVRAWPSAGPRVQGGGHRVARKAVTSGSEGRSHHCSHPNDGGRCGTCQWAAKRGEESESSKFLITATVLECTRWEGILRDRTTRTGQARKK